MKKVMLLTMLFGLVIIATNNVSGQKTNIALKKPATQSSLYSDAYPASKAVDGITTGKDGDFSHTKDQENPWWQVDLGAVYDVGEIVIFNRTDCCMDRLENYFVMLSESPITENSTTKQVVQKGSFPKNSPNRILNLGNGKKGRYVRIFTQNGTMALNLAEVQVFAKEKVNPTSKVEKSPEAKKLEKTIIGVWGPHTSTTLIFRQGECLLYTSGHLQSAHSYRVLDESTVELTDKFGSKSLGKVPSFDNSRLDWRDPDDYGTGLYKRLSQSQIEESGMAVRLRGYMQGMWSFESNKIVFSHDEMKIYSKTGDLSASSRYRVLDDITIELTDKNGKKSLAKIISIDPNGELVWDDPIFGKVVFKRAYGNKP